MHNLRTIANSAMGYIGKLLREQKLKFFSPGKDTFFVTVRGDACHNYFAIYAFGKTLQCVSYISIKLEVKKKSQSILNIQSVHRVFKNINIFCISIACVVTT